MDVTASSSVLTPLGETEQKPNLQSQDPQSLVSCHTVTYTASAPSV